MEYRDIKVEIERSDEQVALVIQEWGQLKIILTNDSVDDIEIWFNTIFDKIVEERESVKFVLEDNNNDLYHEVVDDIISQMNSEIKQSENDFDRIIEITKNTDDIQ